MSGTTDLLLRIITLWILSLRTSVVLGNVIWRCPDFNLLQCKSLPIPCKSFRMIYIRHGDLECPGCLICADHVRSVPEVTSSPSDLNVTEEEEEERIHISRKRRRKLKERERRRKLKEKLKKQRLRERKEKRRRRKKLKKLRRRNRKQIITNEIMTSEG